MGFGNPIPEGMALMVRLANPAALVLNRYTAAAAELGVGGVLDLKGRGIRALEFMPSLDRYLVLAGGFQNSRGSFSWTSGQAGPTPRRARLRRTWAR